MRLGLSSNCLDVNCSSVDRAPFYRCGLSRNIRELRCFNTCTTVEDVPFFGSLISRCT